MNKKYIIAVVSCDCTVEQFLFYGTEEEMFEVLRRKAEEERRELAEFEENVSNIEYDEFDHLWKINIFDDSGDILETVIAKAADTIEYLDL